MASAHIFNLDIFDNVEQILLKLDTQLTEHAGLVSKHKTASFTLSDHFGVVSMMPWQDALSNPDEISNYARLCLESKVTMPDHEWVQHAEFNAYQQPGIAYAFPQLLLAGLDKLCQKHHLKMQRALPISVRVFLNHFKKSSATQQVVLLLEATRSTLASYSGNRMLEIDVEPVFDSSINSANRLLRRLEIKDAEHLSMLLWSTEEVINPDITNLIESLFFSAKITNLPYHFWRHQ